jgi:hypothetical protein
MRYVIGGVERFQEGEPTPCDDCSFAARCRENKLACDRLSLYVKDVSPVRWRLAPRVPTRARFEILADQLKKRMDEDAKAA